MKVKNISENGFSCRLTGYDKEILVLSPNEIVTGIPLICYKGLKGVPKMIKLCWEDNTEKITLSRLSPFYYNVGEFTNAPASAKEIEVSKVTLSENTVNLKVGQDIILETTITPENADNKKVTYSTSDDSVATVSKKGKVIAIAEGEATITVTSMNNVTDTCSVYVTAEESETTSEENSDNESTEEVSTEEQLEGTLETTDEGPISSMSDSAEEVNE